MEQFIELTQFEKQYFVIIVLFHLPILMLGRSGLLESFFRNKEGRFIIVRTVWLVAVDIFDVFFI
jgi:hypothetical protein